MSTQRAIDSISPKPLRFATLSASIPQGLRDDTGNLYSSDDWRGGVVYESPFDTPTIRPFCGGCVGAGDCCWHDPCPSSIGYAMPVEVGTIAGCNSQCGRPTDFRKRVEDFAAANDIDLLLRFLWTGTIPKMAAGCATDWTATPIQQSTILNTGVAAGTAANLEQAIAMAVSAMEQTGYYGQQVILVPRALLAARETAMWDRRGDRLYADDHVIVGIPGAPLPGLAGSTAAWHIATMAGLEWDRGMVKSQDLEPDRCGGLERAHLRTEAFIARITVQPAPQIVGIA